MQVTEFQQHNRILISSRVNLTSTSIYFRGKYSPSVNDFAEKQFRHLYHTLFIAKSKILCLRTRMLTCLGCSSMGACFYVRTCSNVLHACCAQISYVFSQIFFTFESLTSKTTYIEKFLFIQRSI